MTVARLPERFRYVVIEGPIGAGKTSLARTLGERCGARLLLENPDANPFIAEFYRNVERYALPTQLWFLMQRIDQVRELGRAQTLKRPTVADFMLDKDPLFARLTLSDDEFNLYRAVYERLNPQAPAPDLVIYLQASTDTLIERVRRRGTPYEQAISDDYLLRLAEAYARFFHDYSAAPLLVVNSDNLNFVDSAVDFDLLLQRATTMRGAREFFSQG
jgi:deoxyadenosine/deoxycytidine kinase